MQPADDRPTRNNPDHRPDPGGASEGPAAETHGDPRFHVSRLLIPALAILAIIAGLVAFWANNQMRAQGPASQDETLRLGADDASVSEFRGYRIQPERPAPDIRLTDQSGEPFALSSLRGDAVLLFFGFTSCPDICPTTMLTLGQALERMGPAGEDVQVVFVTVDPERDTPDRLREYLAAYEPGTGGHITGLTGELDDIEMAAEAFGVGFDKVVPEGADPEDYTMDHSATVFLIDPFGQLRAGFLRPSPEDVVHDVTLVLDESQ